MRNWRVLCLALSLCFICGLSSGVAFAAEGDTYVDSGLGWYSPLSAYCSDSGILLADYSNGSYLFHKYNDGSAVVFSLIINWSGSNPWCKVFVCSTVRENTAVLSFDNSYRLTATESSSIIYMDQRWYYTSIEYGPSSSYPFSSSFPLLGEYQDFTSDVFSFCLSSLGVTTDSSVVGPSAPAATHELVTYQSSPFVFLAGVNGADGSNRLTGPYEIANNYTNAIFGGGSSVSRWSLGPESGKASAEYVVYRDVDYKASDYVSVSVSGSISGVFSTNNPPFGRAVIYPSSVSLVINDSVYMSSSASFDGFQLTVPDTVLYTNVFGDIYKIGVLLSFDSTLGGFSAGDFATLYFTLHDDLVVSEGEAPAEDPTTVDDIKQDTGQGGILGLLKSLLDFFANFFSFSNLLNGIVGLFVPSSDVILNIKIDYEDLLSDRLGFIWQAGELVVSFFGNLVDSLSNVQVHTFTFPGISFPMNGETVQILGSATVSLENDFMDVVRPVLGTIVSIVCVLAFINTAEDMVIAITSGASYFQFLKGRSDG